MTAEGPSEFVLDLLEYELSAHQEAARRLRLELDQVEYDVKALEAALAFAKKRLA